MKKEIFEIASFTVLIEGIITYFNQFFMQGFCWEMLFSIVIAVAYKLDLPAHFNLKSSVPYVGSVLTGILLSRGLNYVYDFINDLVNILKSHKEPLCLNIESILFDCYAFVSKNKLNNDANFDIIKL